MKTITYKGEIYVEGTTVTQQILSLRAQKKKIQDQINKLRKIDPVTGKRKRSGPKCRKCGRPAARTGFYKGKYCSKCSAHLR